MYISPSVTYLGKSFFLPVFLSSHLPIFCSPFSYFTSCFFFIKISPHRRRRRLGGGRGEGGMGRGYGILLTLAVGFGFGGLEVCFVLSCFILPIV